MALGADTHTYTSAHTDIFTARSNLKKPGTHAWFKEVTFEFEKGKRDCNKRGSQ